MRTRPFLLKQSWTTNLPYPWPYATYTYPRVPIKATRHPQEQVTVVSLSCYSTPPGSSRLKKQEERRGVLVCIYVCMCVYRPCYVRVARLRVIDQPEPGSGGGGCVSRQLADTDAAPRDIPAVCAHIRTYRQTYRRMDVTLFIVRTLRMRTMKLCIWICCGRPIISICAKI